MRTNGDFFPQKCIPIFQDFLQYTSDRYGTHLAPSGIKAGTIAFLDAELAKHLYHLSAYSGKYHDVCLCPTHPACPGSFLGQLFKVSSDPSIISFAGGLPSSELIDTEGLSAAARDVFNTDPRTALQTTTDGYRPLAGVYRGPLPPCSGIPATADEIQITNGSQQCLDLFAKIFLIPAIGWAWSDRVPWAIEAFSLYEPEFTTVPLDREGPDPVVFRKMMKDAP